VSRRSLHWCDLIFDELDLRGIKAVVRNALMETIDGLYKTECIRTTVFHDGPYRTIGDVEFATAGWVDWYNTRRLHSSLGYIPLCDSPAVMFSDSPVREKLM